MAPAGPVPEDPFWGNTMVWNTPLATYPTLSMLTLAATRNPPEVCLDFSGPSVVWRGATAATTEDTPAWSLSPANYPAYVPVNLPVKVKVMKKRNSRIAVFPVRSLPTDRNVPVPSAAALAAEFNRVFGWQVNAWLREADITVHPQTDSRYDGESGDGRHIDANGTFLDDMIPLHRDEAADLNMIVLDKVDMTLGGTLCCGMQIGTHNSFFVVTSYADGEEIPVQSVCTAATHETGHVFALDHPDKDLGPAPLPGTNRTERLMHSAQATHGGKRLVKAEWDEFEEWAKENSDK
jgi:hypothetical protein